MAILSTLLSILIVALGLGFVIFFHELGHFLMAKYNGVKVEAFSIGFGPALAQFRRGDTVYKLGILPLGGYVKMLGEEPEAEESRSKDPRAYHNKSVGGRMTIIAAGVIMNMILGFTCFVITYLWGGKLEASPRIGLVVAGAPASEAGVQVGDEMVSINGRHEVSFFDLLRVVALSGNGDVVHLELKRPGRNTLIPIDVIPRREPGDDRPTIGVWFPDDLILENPPFMTPAGLATPPRDLTLGFGPKDRVIRVKQKR